MQRPKRDRLPFAQSGLSMVNQIQPAILQRADVGFDLSESERVKRAPVLGADLHNHLILIASLFDRDHFCRKRSLFRRDFILPGLEWSNSCPCRL